MTRYSLILAALALGPFGCGESVTRDKSGGILAMGDSMLAWHKGSGNAIPEVIETRLGEEVTDRSVIGARFLYDLPITGAMGLNISKQYRAGDWDWVVLNGGGNDLWFGCGCMGCETIIDSVISRDGQSGKIPALVSKIRRTGARVIYVGYLHSPGAFSIIDHCKAEDIELERRIEDLANRTSGFDYLNVSNIVPMGDLSFHALDRIHPSVKGSRAIASMIVDIIRRQEG